jgi:Na+-transporting NADH:ubiquinone oxidoreductase subunit E
MSDTIAHFAVVFFAAVLTNNILLSQFLGMCSFIAISRSMKTAVGLGMAVTFVMVFTAVINFAIFFYVLIPLQLEYLSFLVFIMLIAGFVQLVEMIIERFSPVLHINLGIYLPLITVNCAILGVSMLVCREDAGFTLSTTLVYALGSGLGWMLAICLMAGIRQRLQHANIPKPLKGLGITMIITGLMAMAFMGFQGIGTN